MKTRAQRIPSTPAVLALRAAGIDFTPHFYEYQEHGGTAVSARALGVDEHEVIKTLVMEDDARRPLLVLMHGDMKVSTKMLARAIGTKGVAPCDAATAERHTGYRVGGTSPFGTRKRLPVYIERTVLDLPRLYINGGQRGFLACIKPNVLARLVAPVTVDVAICN